MAAIEISFVISREEGEDAKFQVTTRRHEHGAAIWDRPLTHYEGQTVILAINTLSRTLQESVTEIGTHEPPRRPKPRAR
jgi:hypothetical protein